MAVAIKLATGDTIRLIEEFETVAALLEEHQTGFLRFSRQRDSDMPVMINVQSVESVTKLRPRI